MMIEYSVVDICMSQIVSIYILVNFLGRFVMVSMAFPADPLVVVEGEMVPTRARKAQGCFAPLHAEARP